MNPTRFSVPVRGALAAIALGLAGASAAQGVATSDAPPSGAPVPCAVPDCRAATADGRGPRHDYPVRREHRQPMMFCALDADRDGRIDRSELIAAQQRQLERFEKADADGDGRLSRQEFMAAKGGLRDDLPAQCGPARRGPGGPGAAVPTPPAGQGG
jgi:hypothetical protein